MGFARYLLGTGILLLAYSAHAETNKLWQPGTFKGAGDGWVAPCSDCYVQQVEVGVPRTGVVVGVDNPTCGNAVTMDFFKLAQAAVQAQINPNSSGNLIEAAKLYAYQNIRNKVGGDFQRILDANGPRITTGMCAPLAAILPKDADVVTVHLGDWDNVVGVGGCPPPPGECAQGFAKFMIRPDFLDGPNPVVATSFMNWSHDRDRIARMFVVFRVPAGKRVLDIS